MPAKKQTSHPAIVKTTIRIQRTVWNATRIAAIQQGVTLQAFIEQALTEAAKGGKRK